MKALFYLFFAIFSISNAFGQVGIQNENPKQTLDVNGKVKIGDDSAIPSEGTMRYSSRDGFEGYTPNGWTSLSTQGIGPLPSNATAVFGYIFGVSVAGYDNAVTLGYLEDLSEFTTVPTNKFLIITAIIIEPNGLNQSGFYEVTIGRAAAAGSINQQSGLRFRGGPDSKVFSDPFGILMVAAAGEQLKVSNESSSNYGINIKIRGFLVDNLKY